MNIPPSSPQQSLGIQLSRIYGSIDRPRDLHNFSHAREERRILRSRAAPNINGDDQLKTTVLLPFRKSRFSDHHLTAAASVCVSTSLPSSTNALGCIL